MPSEEKLSALSRAASSEDFEARTTVQPSVPAGHSATEPPESGVLVGDGVGVALGVGVGVAVAAGSGVSVGVGVGTGVWTGEGVGVTDALAGTSSVSSAS